MYNLSLGMHITDYMPKIMIICFYDYTPFSLLPSR